MRSSPHHTQNLSLNNNDAAELLGVSPGTMRLSRHTGELFKNVPAPSFMKMGRAVRYRRETLISWLEQWGEFENTAQTKHALKKAISTN